MTNLIIIRRVEITIIEFGLIQYKRKLHFSHVVEEICDVLVLPDEIFPIAAMT